METKGMSEYERERQKRIEENRKMLEELFPDGTSLSGPVVRRGPVVKEGTPESSKDGDGTYGSPVTPRTRARRSLVMPRRNPLRKSRATNGTADLRPVTRSMTKVSSGEASLIDGVEDEQELRKVAIRSRKRRHSEEEPVEIELDHNPVCYKSKINKVAIKTTDKVYDRINGTTCHQCRQKTTDTKTVCHNRNCRGVRGQFCGPCLLNRYGEDIREALVQDTWVCPPCRRVCNCSFCLPKRGKPPTGIMIHEARDAGFDSVLEYLEKSNYDY
ncbi:Cell division cycle-associated 7-like protein [Geodia barretti]|uniref:Cell division cycle-associated 7-like protein n=2 Tax=Geodia barretti TaxID=519541 RepID=A0AA35T645_GEOBA|nr:Cell division cycle-associated 7-like protein [Geodia barretti]